ncbi:MAG: CRISPR-associated endoribonuclease Cas6 [bacterium]
MRIKVTLSSDKPGAVNFNYQHQIQAVIYEFLASSDPDYASWLHAQGYVCEKDKRFKLFVYSGIIFQGPVRIKSSNRLNSSNNSIGSNGSGGLNSLNSLNGLNISDGFSFTASRISPFFLSFQIASPVHQFLQHLIDGIFREGQNIRLGSQILNICRVETLPDPLNGNGLNGLNRSNGLNGLLLKPLESPIFVKKPMPAGERDIYLFPGDGDYEKLLNQNLMHKYETLYGKPYEGEPLKFNFQLELFKRLKPKINKSFKIFKNGKITGEIKGTLQPFIVSGPEELIKIGLECGFGQNNSMGCGYVETV